MTASETCPVCLESIIRLTTLSNCEHKFCRVCITEWCKNSSSCPLCRAEVTFLKDPVTHVTTQVAPVTQRSDHAHNSIPSFEIFVQQRRLPRTNPAPDPDFIVEISSSEGSSSSEHPSGSLNYSDSSSASGSDSLSSSFDSNEKSESSDGLYVSDTRDLSPRHLRRRR
jgi:hypothetical protein